MPKNLSDLYALQEKHHILSSEVISYLQISSQTQSSNGRMFQYSQRHVFKIQIGIALETTKNLIKSVAVENLMHIISTVYFRMEDKNSKNFRQKFSSSQQRIKPKIKDKTVCSLEKKRPKAEIKQNEFRQSATAKRRSDI